MLMRDDLNVTLETKDRPNNAGGQDPCFKKFSMFILEAELHEMGLVDCLYTWRSTNGNTLPSWLDRFLGSIELVERYLLADVRSLPRPPLNHTPIIWVRNGSNNNAHISRSIDHGYKRWSLRKR